MALDAETNLRLAYASRIRAKDSGRSANELRQLIRQSWEAVRVSRDLIESSDFAIDRLRCLANGCPWKTLHTR